MERFISVEKENLENPLPQCIHAGHTVTGTGKHLDAKSTTQQINFKDGVAKETLRKHPRSIYP